MKAENEAVLQPAASYSWSAGEAVAGLFTGGVWHASLASLLTCQQGAFNRSVYFMGSFTVEYKKYSADPQSNYNIGLSFLFAGGMYVFVTAALLIHKFVNAADCSCLNHTSVRSAVFNSFLAESDSNYEMAEAVFTTFDHSITDQRSMELKQIGLAQLYRVCLVRFVWRLNCIAANSCGDAEHQRVRDQEQAAAADPAHHCEHCGVCGAWAVAVGDPGGCGALLVGHGHAERHAMVIMVM